MTYCNILCVCCLRVCLRPLCGSRGTTPGMCRVGGVCCGLVGSRRVTAVIASRKRPVPFRTRKLSSIAPMVLHSGGCGRVGRCRTSSLGSGGMLEPPFLGCSLPPLPIFHAQITAPRDAGEQDPGGRSPWCTAPRHRASCHQVALASPHPTSCLSPRAPGSAAPPRRRRCHPMPAPPQRGGSTRGPARGA